MKSFELRDGDLHIVVTGPSAQFFASDLYTQAVVALIQDADTNGWEKHQLDQGGAIGERRISFTRRSSVPSPATPRKAAPGRRG